MFGYKDKPSLTKRPDKPVTARKAPPSQNPGCNHKYKQAVTDNANELVFFCEKCMDIKKKEP